MPHSPSPHVAMQIIAGGFVDRRARAINTLLDQSKRRVKVDLRQDPARDGEFQVFGPGSFVAPGGEFAGTVRVSFYGTVLFTSLIPGVKTRDFMGKNAGSDLLTFLRKVMA